MANYPHSVSNIELKHQQTLQCAEVRTVQIIEMAAQKQSVPSFASIISVLPNVFYCAGFLRVELELNQKEKRINNLAIENVADAEPSSHHPGKRSVVTCRILQPGFFLSLPS